MELLNIVTNWHWRTGQIIPRITKIEGGNLPDDIRYALENHKWGYPPDLGPDSEAHQKATTLMNIIANQLPLPVPYNVGTDTTFVGHILGVQLMNFIPPEQIYISYYVQYENLKDPLERPYNIQIANLSTTLQDLVRDVSIQVNNHVISWFLEQYGRGEYNPAKWKAKKTHVFISYRSYAEATAFELRDLLGFYEDSSVFVPIINRVDMNAGDWRERLLKLIDESQVFLPLLTRDYLEGPVTKWEVDIAVFKEKHVVPILIEGNAGDYKWLSKYNIVKAKDGIKPYLEEIARLALGLTQKHNEFI